MATSSAAASSTQANISLDRVLTEITSTNNFLALNHALRTFATKDVRESILSSLLPGGQDPLTILDIQRDTLGVLFILSARFLVSSVTLPRLSYVENFCRNFDIGQASLAADRMISLARSISQVAESMDSPKLALTCLYYMVNRYPPSLSHLTPIHPLFVAACVATGHFEMALSVVRTPITEIDTSITDLHYNDNLIYHYVGGMTLAALKKWDEAEELFEICVSSPAHVPAAIQLDAYKKLILVQLISRGKTSDVPKYTRNILTRLIRSSPYNSLVKAYPQQISVLRHIVEKDLSLFTNDNNVGLINQALERAPRWLIKKLTSTYLTLGLAEIGKSVGIASVEEVRATILSMIEQDEICATISADGTVTFTDPPSQFSKREIDKLLRDAQQQGELLARLNREMGKSKEFVVRASKNKEDWGPPEEEIFGGSGSGSWMDEGY